MPSAGSLVRASDTSTVLDPPRCKVRNTAATSLATSVWTAVLFATEDIDSTTTMHSTSSNTDQVVIPVAGTYAVAGMVSVVSSAAGSIRGGRFTFNGTTMSGRTAVPPNAAPAAICVPVATQLVACIAGDIIRLEGFQNSGGPLNTDIASTDVQSTLSVWYVGP